MTSNVSVAKVGSVPLSSLYSLSTIFELYYLYDLSCLSKLCSLYKLLLLYQLTCIYDLHILYDIVASNQHTLYDLCSHYGPSNVNDLCSIVALVV